MSVVLFDRKSDLKQLLNVALTQLIDRLNKQFRDREIYGLVFLPSSGYRQMSVSFATNEGLAKHSVTTPPGLDSELLEMLKGHPDLLKTAMAYDNPQLYFEVNACEWDGFGVHGDLFVPINKLISSGYDSLADEMIESEEIGAFFEGMLTEILIDLRESGSLKSSAFTEDVLLGIQFPDSSNRETVIRVSKSLNSTTWHEKVCEAYDLR